MTAQAPLNQTETAIVANPALAASVGRAEKRRKTFNSATKNSAARVNETRMFCPGDIVKCVNGHDNKWPLETGKTYMVAIDVIAGFNHRGPASGIILDPCPNRHGVSVGPNHPYVWDNERFVFFYHPRDMKPVVQKELTPPLEPYGFD